MDAIELLRIAQAVLYILLAVAAIRVWARDRSRPAAYLAIAFLTLAAAVSLGRLLGAAGLELAPVRFLQGELLLAFPWALAAFAWSFEGPLPRWLRGAGLLQLLLAGGLALLSPLEPPGARPPVTAVFVAVTLTVWVALIAVAALRLWRADPRHRIVRARTRSMAAGGFTLGAVLLVSGTVSTSEAGEAALLVLTLFAGVAFAMGFTPPKALRLWWLQLAPAQASHLQTSLIAAVSPRDIATAVVPVIALTYGAGVAFLDRDGTLLASEGSDPRDLLDGGTDGGHRGGRVRVAEVEGYRLVMETSPYAPVLGTPEEQLLDRFRLQLRLALQRAALAAAHETARAELQRAYDEQQAMLIGLAHDLRSPTVTIAAYGALLDDAQDLDDARAMAADIRVSAAYLDRLVDGISELSRIGRRDGVPEVVALEEVVARTAERLGATCPELRVETTGRLPVLLADRLRIEQVIDNLLSNACRHGGRPDVTVRLDAAPITDGVRVIVADDGRGIPEDEHEAVFGLFRRGSTSDEAGSGVGLGLVRRIVDSLGGRIQLVPAHRGARFVLDLPAALVRTGPTSQEVRRDRAASSRSASAR